MSRILNKYCNYIRCCCRQPNWCCVKTDRILTRITNRLIRDSYIVRNAGRYRQVMGYRPPLRDKTSGQRNPSNSEVDELNAEMGSDNSDVLGSDEHDSFVQRLNLLPGMGHQVFVIQPAVKWGPQKVTTTTPKLQLEEAVALAETLPKWKVVEKIITPVKTLKTKFIFGSGTLDTLRQKIASDKKVTAVFISINMLNGIQHNELEKVFNVPVYDRYTIVLQIFKDHAYTREAKLQIALAEIPYLRARLKEMHETRKSWHDDDRLFVGGSSDNILISDRKKLLMDREMKIRKELEKIKSHREMLRNSRIKKGIPIVAIVGYTNAGKTSLIKSLTDERGIIPKDQLFATLDVTAHSGRLPCNLKVIYMDTVGFISDIPTSLIASFRSTLEDVSVADLIIHVRDISHSDSTNQKIKVLETLNSLDLPEKLLETMIEVNNKIDLCETQIESDAQTLNVSAVTGEGLARLLQDVEKSLLSNTDQVIKVFRVPIGGPQENWLRKEGGIKTLELDEERENYYKLTVVLSRMAFLKFCDRFNVRRVTKKM